MVLETFLGALRRLGRKTDSDFVDMLHYFITSNVCIAFSFLISYKQFGGKPIECMFPSKFSGSWEDYAENYCFAQNTYYVRMTDEIAGSRLNPSEEELKERRFNEVPYYQWVPFFLLFQAACFRLPSLLWNFLAQHSGLKIHDIVQMAIDKENVEQDKREHSIQTLTVHLSNVLRFHRKLQRKKIVLHKYCRPLNLPYTAFFVTTMYLLTKLLYASNVFLQLYLLSSFLGVHNYSFFGLGVLQDIVLGVSWEYSGIFPRVTLCDFEVREVANVQKYTVQCILVINMLNEKIFVFLWLWYSTLFIVTCASFAYWFLILFLPFVSESYIGRTLALTDLPFDRAQSSGDVKRFVRSYLHPDGIFAIRMLTMHAGIIFGKDLVLALWKNFYHIEEQVRRKSTAGSGSPAPIAPVAPLNPALPKKNESVGLDLRFRRATKDSQPSTPRSPSEKQMSPKLNSVKRDGSLKRVNDELKARLLNSVESSTDQNANPTAPIESDEEK